jgi:DNA-binding response OmpR family regulator
MSKILVVDDDVDILSVMEILLSMKGFEVKTLAKGQDIFSTVQNFDPDLILLDVLISGYDGRVVCKKLKSSEKTKDIPVIMFSAHPGAAATIADYGANDFISKPFDVTNLMKKINSQLGMVSS